MNDRFWFRVWSYEQKRMINSWDYSSKRDFLYGALIDHRFFGNGLFITIQSTGLKDKNGKLIFEGDIVRFIYGNKKRLGYVEENKTVWSITNSNFCQGAWCGGALINLYETCEIIGNIYEDKELLEDTECQK